MDLDSVGQTEHSSDGSLFQTEAYDYALPPHLIAQESCPERDKSRLLVLSKSTGECHHTWFYRIQEHLREGDLLVVNASKVIPARLFGRKSTGGEVEFLLLSPCSLQERSTCWDTKNIFQEKDWLCLMRCSGNPRPGTIVHFGNDFEATILQKDKEGIWKIRFHTEGNLEDELERVGLTPLPPYIKRKPRKQDERTLAIDRERYQTIFAETPGSVAAPTAGLHFTRELCQRLDEAGIGFAEITLHVGLATFRPMRVTDIRSHTLLPERYSISEESSVKINSALKEGRRVIAVGTTVVRCLESAFGSFGEIVPHNGWATLCILPGYSFRIINAIITNFHLPRTSLMVLVSAFAGRDVMLHAYQEAIQSGYRFYSYGDAMCIQ